MQDCPKCGKKIKTLYERHGEKATYESMGYLCRQCGILYDKDLKKSASASSLLVVVGAQAVNGNEQDRTWFAAEPLTGSNRLSKQVLHENVRRPGFEPGLPDWQSDVLDQTGRPSQLFPTIQKSLFKVWVGTHAPSRQEN